MKLVNILNPDSIYRALKDYPCRSRYEIPMEESIPKDRPSHARDGHFSDTFRSILTHLKEEIMHFHKGCKILHWEHDFTTSKGDFEIIGSH